jgi:hypothetical protein
MRESARRFRDGRAPCVVVGPLDAEHSEVWRHQPSLAKGSHHPLHPDPDANRFHLSVVRAMVHLCLVEIVGAAPGLGAHPGLSE